MALICFLSLLLLLVLESFFAFFFLFDFDFCFLELLFSILLFTSVDESLYFGLERLLVRSTDLLLLLLGDLDFLSLLYLNGTKGAFLKGMVLEID